MEIFFIKPSIYTIKSFIKFTSTAYMADILPIRRKTLYNQSINHLPSTIYLTLFAAECFKMNYMYW